MVTHLLVRRVRYTDTPSQSVLSGTGLLCASLVQPLATLSGMRRAKKKVSTTRTTTSQSLLVNSKEQNDNSDTGN
jgi:hypothetical protein